MDLPRFLLVLGSFSPLFLLWAIRGIAGIDHFTCILFFLPLAVIPTLYLVSLIAASKRQNDRVPIAIHSATDNREHLLAYLFAMLIPFYDANITSEQDALATIAAILFIIYIFGHLGLYYMNFWLAFFGYRILTIHSDQSSLAFSTPHILITKKEKFSQDQKMTPIRITDGVLFDDQK